VSANGGTGIRPGTASLVIENTIVANGDRVAGEGVACGTGCRVHGNTVRANTDTGLDFSLDGAYTDNNITANTLLPVSGGTPRGGNFCDGTGVVAAACP